MNSKNLIIGTGPVGIAVAEALIRRGKKVTLINRSGRRPEAFTEGDVEMVACDVMNQAELAHAAQKKEYIFHCANPLYHQWRDILPVIQQNTIKAALENNATLAVSENLYMFAGTAFHLEETTPEAPPTKKGIVRKELSDRLREVGNLRGLRWTSIRASDYYGPWSTDQSMFGTRRFLDPISRKANPALIGKLEALHSYTFISDFGEALVTAALDPRAHHNAWICPNAPARTTGEVARMFFDEYHPKEGHCLRVKTIPDFSLKILGMFNPVIRELIEMLYQKKQTYVANGKLFADTFGLKPTPLVSGVRQTVEWYKSVKSGQVTPAALVS